MSPGRAAEVFELVMDRPRRAAQLVECLWDEDPGVVNRAAEAVELISREKPRLLQAWSAALQGLLAEATQIKLRWKLAVVVPRLELSEAETRRVAGLLHGCLEDRSSVVKTYAMEGLAELTRQNAALLPEVLDLLHMLTAMGTAAIHPTNKDPFVGTPAIHPTNKDPFVGTPAMRARGRMLLKRLEPSAPGLPRGRKRAPSTFREYFELPGFSSNKTGRTEPVIQRATGRPKRSRG